MFDWTCPYCNKQTTIHREHYYTEKLFHVAPIDTYYRVYQILRIICPGTSCKKDTVLVTYSVEKRRPHGGPDMPEGPVYFSGQNTKKIWRLFPKSDAKVFPEYIPIAIREDYQEACAIKELSPKASAALSRRCIQGIIRDFWNIKKGSLKDEIDALENEPKVDPETINAIDAIRTIGNIGAHMEKDVDLIIDIEPHEAELLTQLIEMLLEEWYVHRHEREQKLQKIAEAASQKNEQKHKAKNAIPQHTID